MKLTIRRVGMTLMAADDISRTRIMKIPMGEVYDAELDGERCRSNSQNARYWARVNAALDMIPEGFEQVFMDNLFAEFRFQQIDEGTLHNFVKMMCGVESIAFDKLNHSKACAFFTDADAVLDRLEKIAGGMADA